MTLISFKLHELKVEYKIKDTWKFHSLTNAVLYKLINIRILILYMSMFTMDEWNIAITFQWPFYVSLRGFGEVILLISSSLLGMYAIILMQCDVRPMQQQPLKAFFLFKQEALCITMPLYAIAACCSRHILGW